MKRWHIAAIVAALLLLAFLASRFVDAAGGCGAGLAAQDLAGNCRAALPTPGALEAVAPPSEPKPVPPKPHGIELHPVKP